MLHPSWAGKYFERLSESSNGSQHSCLPEDPKIALHLVLDAIRQIAKDFEDGRVTTIVIDDANKLITKDFEVLSDLQDFAQGCAASCLVCMIFIDSGGSALRFMKGRRAAFEMKQISMEDVAKAKEYLKKNLADTKLKND